MRVACLVAVCCVSFVYCSATAAESPQESLVKQIVAVAGGEDKLLKLFRTRETVSVGSDPEKKVPARVSVYEPPKYWWTGKNERVKDNTV